MEDLFWVLSLRSLFKGRVGALAFSVKGGAHTRLLWLCRQRWALDEQGEKEEEEEEEGFCCWSHDVSCPLSPHDSVRHHTQTQMKQESCCCDCCDVPPRLSIFCYDGSTDPCQTKTASCYGSFKPKLVLRHFYLNCMYCMFHNYVSM